MTIIKTEVLSDNEQEDGRRRIYERHTDDAGKTYDYTYLAEANDNVESIAASRAITIQDEVNNV